jgi:hypothetical protein
MVSKGTAKTIMARPVIAKIAAIRRPATAGHHSDRYSCSRQKGVQQFVFTVGAVLINRKL